MLTCSVCKAEVEEGTSYMAAIEKEGTLYWRWGCEHHPVDDAAVILGSSKCAEMFAQEHPEHSAAIDRLVVERLEKTVSRAKEPC